METIEYNVSIGDSIYNAIDQSLLISKDKNKVVFFVFNDISMDVDYQNDNKDSLIKKWKTKNEKRFSKYKESNEYKTKEKQKDIELKNNQLKIEALLNDFPSKVNKDFIIWLKSFCETSDNIGVTFDKDTVIKKLYDLGFKNNDYVGFKGKWTPQTLTAYTVGQVINCIMTFGVPHPISVKFCNDILEMKDTSKKDFFKF